MLIENFVRAMVSGCVLSVASKNGQQQVTCLLDADLKSLTVRAKDGSQKPIPLVALDEGMKVGKMGRSIEQPRVMHRM